jgi:replicative DNA helicase
MSNTSDVHRIGDGSKTILHSRAENPLEVPGIPTGFDRLDLSLQGLQPGKLYVLAARYKVGKSIWLMNVVRHVAVNLGVPVLVIDTENPSQQIDDRLLSLQSGVEELKVRNGMFKFEEGAADKLDKASDELAKSQIYHCYMPNFTFEAALSLIKKYRMQKNIGLVVFDYIKAPDNTNFSAIQEYQLLGHLTSGLKNKVAGTLDIPVLTACQLGRKAIGQDTAADDHVADSDRIGRYADVLLYFREKSEEEKEKYGCTKHTGNMVMTVQINRGGPAKDYAYDLFFDRPTMKISEVKARQL